MMQLFFLLQAVCEYHVSVNECVCIPCSPLHQIHTLKYIIVQQCSAVTFLAKQGLAVRGHSEAEGNLMQLLKLRSEDVFYHPGAHAVLIS